MGIQHNINRLPNKYNIYTYIMWLKQEKSHYKYPLSKDVQINVENKRAKIQKSQVHMDK